MNELKWQRTQLLRRQREQALKKNPQSQAAKKPVQKVTQGPVKKVGPPKQVSKLATFDWIDTARSKPSMVLQTDLVGCLSIMGCG